MPPLGAFWLHPNRGGAAMHRTQTARQFFRSSQATREPTVVSSCTDIAWTTRRELRASAKNRQETSTLHVLIIRIMERHGKAACPCKTRPAF